MEKSTKILIGIGVGIAVLGGTGFWLSQKLYWEDGNLKWRKVNNDALNDEFAITLQNSDPTQQIPVQNTSTRAQLLSSLPVGTYPIEKGQASKKVLLVQFFANQVFGKNLKEDGKYGASTEDAIFNITTKLSKEYPAIKPAKKLTKNDITLLLTYLANSPRESIRNVARLSKPYFQ